MPLGKVVGLGPGHIVLDGDPAPGPPQKGAETPQIFGPCLLRPNGRMDEAGAWHGDRPQPRRICVKWGPSPPLNFRPMFVIVIVISLEHCSILFLESLIVLSLFRHAQLHHHSADS